MINLNIIYYPSDIPPPNPKIFKEKFLSNNPKAFLLIPSDSGGKQYYSAEIEKRSITSIRGFRNVGILITNLWQLNSDQQIELFIHKDSFNLHIYTTLPDRSCDLMDCWWDYFKEYHPEQLI